MPVLLFYLPQGHKSTSVRSNRGASPDPKQDSASVARTSKLLLAEYGNDASDSTRLAAIPADAVSFPDFVSTCCLAECGLPGVSTEDNRPETTWR